MCTPLNMPLTHQPTYLSLYTYNMLPSHEVSNCSIIGIALPYSNSSKSIVSRLPTYALCVFYNNWEYYYTRHMLYSSNFIHVTLKLTLWGQLHIYVHNYSSPLGPKVRIRVCALLRSTFYIHLVPTLRRLHTWDFYTH